MLNFKPCTPELLRSLLPRFHALPTLCTELSAGTIWMWRDEQEPEICIYNDTMVLRQVMNGYPAFTYPQGADPDGMLDELLLYVREKNIALRFFVLNEDQLQRVLQDPRFPDTLWGYERRWSDYLYSWQTFTDLAGGGMRRLRQKFNHYRNLYGEPDIRPLTEERLQEAHEMLDAYELEHPEKSRLEEAELRHSHELLDVCRTLELPAAGLWTEGRLTAVTIGEIIGETLMIHVEKALLSCPDAYIAVFLGFLGYLRKQGVTGLRYINREDDAGDPGLRTVKERFHPERMIHKYLAHVRTPGARMQDFPVFRGKNFVLTPFRETDKDAYYRMNTDRINNRFWGYDYEEDYLVPRNPTPDDFYQSVQYDMTVGDSVNYAIRITEDGPMVGEALLWNFTYAGSVELGVRLLPEYIGRGLSHAADPLLDYVEEQLGLSTRVRCLNTPENRRALRGANASGFREVRRDETWVYLERSRKDGGNKA